MEVAAPPSIAARVSAIFASFDSFSSTRPSDAVTSPNYEKNSGMQQYIRATEGSMASLRDMLVEAESKALVSQRRAAEHKAAADRAANVAAEWERKFNEAEAEFKQRECTLKESCAAQMDEQLRLWKSTCVEKDKRLRDLTVQNVDLQHQLQSLTQKQADEHSEMERHKHFSEEWKMKAKEYQTECEGALKDICLLQKSHKDENSPLSDRCAHLQSECADLKAALKEEQRGSARRAEAVASLQKELAELKRGTAEARSASTRAMEASTSAALSLRLAAEESKCSQYLRQIALLTNTVKSREEEVQQVQQKVFHLERNLLEEQQQHAAAAEAQQQKGAAINLGIDLATRHRLWALERSVFLANEAESRETLVSASQTERAFLCVTCFTDVVAAAMSDHVLHPTIVLPPVLEEEAQRSNVTASTSLRYAVTPLIRCGSVQHTTCEVQTDGTQRNAAVQVDVVATRSTGLQTDCTVLPHHDAARSSVVVELQFVEAQQRSAMELENLWLLLRIVRDWTLDAIRFKRVAPAVTEAAHLLEQVCKARCSIACGTDDAPPDERLFVLHPLPPSSLLMCDTVIAPSDDKTVDRNMISELVSLRVQNISLLNRCAAAEATAEEKSIVCDQLKNVLCSVLSVASEEALLAHCAFGQLAAESGATFTEFARICLGGFAAIRSAKLASRRHVGVQYVPAVRCSRGCGTDGSVVVSLRSKTESIAMSTPSPPRYAARPVGTPPPQCARMSPDIVPVSQQLEDVALSVQQAVHLRRQKLLETSGADDAGSAVARRSTPQTGGDAAAVAPQLRAAEEYSKELSSRLVVAARQERAARQDAESLSCALSSSRKRLGIERQWKSVALVVLETRERDAMRAHDRKPCRSTGCQTTSLSVRGSLWSPRIAVFVFVVALCVALWWRGL